MPTHSGEFAEGDEPLQRAANVPPAESAVRTRLICMTERPVSPASGTKTCRLEIIAPEGVRLSVTEATTTGWSATAAAPSGARCAVFFGAARPVPPATTSGQISCR